MGRWIEALACGLSTTGSRLHDIRLPAIALAVVAAVLCLLSVAMHRLGPMLGVKPDDVAVFLVTREWSLPSIFGYLTALLAAAMLWASHRRSRRFAYLSWAVVVLAICIDDAFEYHERVGRLLTTGLQLPAIAGLRAQDLGEMLAWGAMAVLLVPAVVSALRTIDGVARSVHAVFFVLLGALLFFGMDMDMVHVVAPGWADPFIGFLEDGGEIAVLVLMAIAAMAFHASEGGSVTVAQPSPDMVPAGRSTPVGAIAGG